MNGFISFEVVVIKCGFDDFVFFGLFVNLVEGWYDDYGWVVYCCYGYVRLGNIREWWDIWVLRVKVYELLVFRYVLGLVWDYG